MAAVWNSLAVIQHQLDINTIKITYTLSIIHRVVRNVQIGR